MLSYLSGRADPRLPVDALQNYGQLYHAVYQQRAVKKITPAWGCRSISGPSGQPPPSRMPRPRRAQARRAAAATTLGEAEVMA